MTASNSYPQRGGPSPMPDSTEIIAQVDTLVMKLFLSEEQKTKLQSIYLSNAEEMKAAFENNQGDRRAMRDTMMKLRDKRDGDIKAILTSEQKKQYDKIIESEREARRQRFMQRRGGRGF